MLDIGQTLAAEFKKYGYKVPDKELSYCLAKLFSCCSKEIRAFLKIWNKKCPINNQKSIKKLGMKKYKDFKTSIIEMGYALIKFGNVPDKTHQK